MTLSVGILIATLLDEPIVARSFPFSLCVRFVIKRRFRRVFTQASGDRPLLP